VLRGGPRSKAVFAPLATKGNRVQAIREKLLDELIKLTNNGLTDQDNDRKWWPHATVVNKTPPEEASSIFDHLMETKEAEKVSGGKALGLDLWYYKRGPWEHIQRFDLQG